MSAPEQQPSLIVRQSSPSNLEFPFASLSEWLIPADLFFVRNHFPSPDLDARDWRLRIDGAVERPLELDLDRIKAMAPTTLAAVVECAGNGRVYYEPAREGLQWQNGAVGNAEWTGVLLRDILAAAGLKGAAQEVLLVGADRGVVDSNKKTASPGPIAFARSLPLQKAIADSTLLAYAMNDAPLTPDHGHPLRAVVGGWFGMAWVKWITHVRVLEQPFLGYWQARDYFRWERGAGEPMLVPLTEMEVKAQIARPVNGASLVAGQPYRIFGAAWSGEAACPAGACLRRRRRGLAGGAHSRQRTPLCVAIVGIYLDSSRPREIPAAVSRHRRSGTRSARSAAVRFRELRRQLDRSRGGRGRA